MAHTLQAYRDNPALLQQFTHRDPVPCICGRCGVSHTKVKRSVRMAIANNAQEHFYCTKKCSSLRDGTWEVREGVEGRVCKTCLEWTPRTQLHQRRGWKCNTCAHKMPRFRFSTYKRRAKKAGIEFDLTYDEFMAHWQAPCHYCGSDIETIGLDRVDSSQGYTAANVVPCCHPCNWMKGDGSTEDFISRCVRVAELHP